MFNSVANPVALWNSFKESLVEDYTYRFQHKERGIAHYYRRLATWYFEMTGNKIAALGIELLEFCALEPRTLEYSEEPFQPMVYCYENLSKTQKQVFDAIIGTYQTFVQGSKLNCVFLDGPAGSGKTFL